MRTLHIGHRVELVQWPEGHPDVITQADPESGSS
jgi:hypothetical protein